MGVAVIISLVVSVVLAIFASVTAPLILAHRTEAMHREDREADWKRQDEVARVAKEASDALLVNQRNVAAEAARTAEDLRLSQKLIADKAAEAAELLLAANERVASTAAETSGKLDVIHTLVNSNMTAAMQSELDATRRELALMLENARLNDMAGHQATTETLAAISATTGKVAELAAAMADRLKASDQIDAAAAAAAAAADDDPPAAT